MEKSNSISLGDYFDRFVRDRINEGRYENADEVVRAGLRLLEEEEGKLTALRNAIREGDESGIAVDFDPQKHLEFLKTSR